MNFQPEIVNPNEIENESFRIISEELSHIHLPSKYAHIIKRVIHTSADFEYAQLLEFHTSAVENGENCLKQGCRIYADTSMIMAGISKPALAKYRCGIHSFIADKDVAQTAKDNGVTRSIAGIDKAFEQGGFDIFIVGNAPTALFRICELSAKRGIIPQLVIGVPVGFVGASESKLALKNSGIPYILTRGRKGGSTIAVAIINAILYSLKQG